jgi:predicted O-linked N-acetylglucosamine transferase (SPINDLY family)
MSPLAEKIKPHANSRDPDRRIRIGYVSADFKGHSACIAFAPLILDHDQEHFDIFCYDGNTVADLMTERLRSAATGWRSSAGLSDDALADRIREDSIDILVDLSGHSMGNRVLVFGQKPAPLQVTGIGHMPPGSPTIDYRLTSELHSPPAEEHLYPEKAVYLNVAMGFLPPQESPLVGPGPGAENGDFIFGSFNRLEKISNEALNLWAGILRDVPKSRLLMKSNRLGVRAARERYEDLFSDLGILPERLILLGGTSQREHLETHDRVEISLDTFPHGGGVTTLESLWMGVPVLGLCDYSKNVSRSIKVLCDPLDLGNWATESLDEYHQTAVDWTSKREALADLRQGLRDRVAEVYFRFPLEVEKSYRVMWARWCAGESPTAIDISNGA